VDKALYIIQLKLINNEEKQLITCIRTIMNQTYFRFNDTTYKQIDGIPMGSPTSGLISGIFSWEIEEKYLHNLKL